MLVSQSEHDTLLFSHRSLSKSLIQPPHLFRPKPLVGADKRRRQEHRGRDVKTFEHWQSMGVVVEPPVIERDRKSTRLNSSHGYISYAVFCLKKKKKKKRTITRSIYKKYH